MNMDKEIWKDIRGFEGEFQVSNYGRIKRLAQICIYKSHNQYNEFEYSRELPEKIFPKRRKTGRNSVTLSDGKDYYVYRLVAANFIRPLKPKEEVNHIDGNKRNDRLDNLEIVTRVENQNHAYDTGLNTYFAKAIPVEINGIKFDSIGAAARYFDVKKSVILGKLRNPNYKPYKNAKTIPYDVKRL